MKQQNSKLVILSIVQLILIIIFIIWVWYVEIGGFLVPGAYFSSDVLSKNDDT